MTYPMPTNTDTNSLTSFFQYISVLTGGFFFPIMLLVIWLVVFMATKAYKNSIAFATASFVCAVMSIPLAVMQVLAPRYMYLSFFLLAIGTLWLKLDK